MTACAMQQAGYVSVQQMLKDGRVTVVCQAAMVTLQQAAWYVDYDKPWVRAYPTFVCIGLYLWFQWNRFL